MRRSRQERTEAVAEQMNRVVASKTTLVANQRGGEVSDRGLC